MNLDSNDISSVSSLLTDNNVDESEIQSTESLNSFKSDETIKADQQDNEDIKPEWIDLLGSGSILKKIVKEGTPDTRPKRLENCKIRYECTLEDGTIVEKLDDFLFQLGDCEVVQGLDVAIGLMNVGEACFMKIEPRLAYGSKGFPPLVPPETTVHFDIELLSVEPETDLETLSITERKAMGNKKRKRGNWWYGRNENNLAIQCYRRALDYLDEVEGGIRPTKEDETIVTDSALQELLEDRISVCNNMAAAQLKLGLHDAALNSLQTVLRCQPDNLKALFRKAKVYRAKNDLQTALKCLQRANEILPNEEDILKELTTITSLIQKQKVSERELARRMFNGPKSDKEEAGRKKGKSTKILAWAALATSIVVGFLGLAAYKFKI